MARTVDHVTPRNLFCSNKSKHYAYICSRERISQKCESTKYVITKEEVQINKH